MIPRPTLKKLISKRLIDAKVLLNNRRYFASIYIAGYALELTLKYRITKLMKFSRGFPENKYEYNEYHSDTAKSILRTAIRDLSDIRHHNLPGLLHYSGEQVNVETNYSSEWNYVKGWNPAMRYTNPIIRKQRAQDFLKYTRSIINGIL